MKLGVLAAALIGLALALYLIFHVGAEAVFAAVAAVGWGGFALIYFYGFVVVSVLGAGWYFILPPGRRISFAGFVIGRQIRDSASDILPFSQLGGIVIGTRAVILRGLPASLAFGSAIADVTTELMAEIVFIAGGTALCLTQLRASPAIAPYADGLVAGIVLLVPGVAVFVFLQKNGSALAGRLARRFLPAALHHTDAFGAVVNAVYAAPGRLAVSATLHLLGWIASGIGTWISLRLIGADIDMVSAIAIESLLAGLRSATVFVPGAVGVQEAGYAALLPLFGFGPEIGLAVSLLRRARDVGVGVPVLLLWQAMEGKRAFAKPDERFSEN